MKVEYEISLSTVLDILKSYKYQGKYMNFKKFLFEIARIKNICGIYAFQNSENKKIYAGSSKAINTRIRSHINMLKNNSHHSPHLQHAWNNGASFNLLILESFEDESILIEREQNWMNYFQSYNDSFGYNISPTAGNTLGVTPSEETRLKMSKAGKGRKFTSEHKRKISIANKGKKLSPEHIAKMSERQKGYVMPESTKEKIRNSCKGKNDGRKHTVEARIKISKARKGTTKKDRKLSESDIRNIRIMLENGERQLDISKKFNVAKSLIYSIHHKKIYRDII